MAKISARGHTEYARWKTPGGMTYVLRTDGALLRKFSPTSGYSVFKKLPTFAKFPEARDAIVRWLDAWLAAINAVRSA
jgi:hypothetical protein